MQEPIKKHINTVVVKPLPFNYTEQSCVVKRKSRSNFCFHLGAVWYPERCISTIIILLTITYAFRNIISTLKLKHTFRKY